MAFAGILISCLLGGTAFAAIAAWLTTKRGNTISDVLNSQHLKDAEAIKIEILDKIKIRSTIPIVALYVIACTVAIALPAYVIYMTKKSDQTITLQGTVLGKKPNRNVDIVPSNMTVAESGWFNIPLMDRTGYQTVNFQSQHYEPLTLNVKVNKEDDTITVSFSNLQLKEESIKLDSTRSAQIQQHPPLYESVAKNVLPQNVPSTPGAVSPVNTVGPETNAAPVSMLPRR